MANPQRGPSLAVRLRAIHRMVERVPEEKMSPHELRELVDALRGALLLLQQERELIDDEIAYVTRELSRLEKGDKPR